MDDWFEKVNKIVGEHAIRRKNIENIFKKLLGTDEIIYECGSEMIDKNNLIWNISIAHKTFTISNEEIIKAEKFNYCDLENAIKIVILEKIENR